MLVTTVVLAGCGGGTNSGPMRATLTLDGCAYEGDTSPAPGLFTIEVRNQTPYGANFVLYELADDLEGTSQLPGNERTGDT